MIDRASQIVKIQQGFTLIELIIVIVVVGILAVTAGPRIVGKAGTDEAVVEGQVLSLLRLQQQRALQDPINRCYGVAITGAHIEPVNCGEVIAADRIVSLPSHVTVSVTTTLPNGGTGFYFNGLGCPVSTGHATNAETCGQSSVQLSFQGVSVRQICVQSQGYIRTGSCP